MWLIKSSVSRDVQKIAAAAYGNIMHSKMMYISEEFFFCVFGSVLLDESFRDCTESFRGW